MTSGAPSVPDPSQVAQAQISSNQQTIDQSLKSSNQQTPFGSLTYTPGPNGTWTAVQNYSPQEQALLTALQGGQGQAINSVAPLLASGNYSAGTPDFANISAGPTADLVSQATNSIIPQASFAIDQQNNSLQNMGLGIGSEAYNRGMEPLFQGLGSAISGFEAQFQPTAFGEAMQQWQAPEQMGSALAQLGAPTPLAGTWAGSPTVQAPFSNMASLYQNQFQNKANQFGGMLSGINGLMSGLGGLATPGAAGISGGGNILSGLGGLLALA